MTFQPFDIHPAKRYTVSDYSLPQGQYRKVITMSGKSKRPGYHPLWSNFPTIFTANFRLILFFLPSLLSLLAFVYLGGLVFLLSALLLLLPAGPAVAAMYDTGYQLCMSSDGTVSRPFMRSYKMNLKQGIATMAIQLPFLFLLIMVLIVQAQRPLWLDLCLLISGAALMAFSILAFSQIALIEMPLSRILKNTLILIPLSGWRSLAPAVVQTLAVLILLLFFWVVVPLFFFAGPALLIVWSCRILWPVMEEVIRRETT